MCIRDSIEVILLDIIMPLLNGMETAHEIRKNDAVVKIIFLTSSPEFALESYDAVSYTHLFLKWLKLQSSGYY